MTHLVPALALLVGCEIIDGGPIGSTDPIGDFSVSDTGGTIDVTVSVPSSPVGTMAYCGGFGDQTLAAVWQLTDPDGNVVYSGDAPEGSAFRSDFVDDLSPMVLPMSPRLPLTAGDWQVQWFVGPGAGGRTIQCGAVHRTGSASDSASIDVDVVIVGASLPTDAADPNLVAALDQLRSEWATANLTPDIAVSWFDGDVERFRVVEIDTAADDYTEFNDLLRETSAGDTLTFYLVEELRDAGGGTLLGLSAGPPGAAGLGRTSKSGVVVTAADLATAPTDVGKIMAHEGGHFLGLYHTTERAGDRFDSLDDTPQCPASADTDSNGRLSLAECAGQGADNVMFWTLTEGAATLSSDQSWVLRRNPIVK